MAQPEGFSVEAQILLEAFQSQTEALRASIQAGFEPSVAYDKRTGPITLALDLRGVKGRLQLEVWAKFSGAAIF